MIFLLASGVYESLFNVCLTPGYKNLLKKKIFPYFKK